MSGPEIDIRAEVRAIAPYNAGLTIADVAARYGAEKISKLGSNENPFGPAPAVLAALTAALSTPHIYPDPSGRQLRAALARKHGLDPAQIILGNGSEDLLSVLCRTLLSPGDRVVTLYPSFPLHEDYANVLGARVERIALRPDLTIDVDALCAAAASGPRLLLFSNPMNPSGTWLSPDDLRRLVAATPRHTIFAIDEAYAEYAAGEDYLPAPEALAGHDGNWIVLRTFSKAWGLAGLRIGYGLVSNIAINDLLDRIRTPFNTNGPAQAAALAALGEENHTLGVARQTIAERERLRAELTARFYRVAPSRGNFLFFDTGGDATAISESLLAQGVIVKPWKQEGYQSFIRVSIGTRAEIDHFLAALDRTRL